VTASMEPQLVILRSVEPGQGKTRVCQDLAAWLRSQNRLVGGFSVLRAYGGADPRLPIAFYVHLYRTDERVRLSHSGLRADETIDFEGRRTQQSHYLPQHLGADVTGRILDQVEADHADPEVEALILDELGPVMTATRHRHGRRAERLPGIVAQVLSEPKPFTVVVCPANIQWADAHDAQREVEIGVSKFPGSVHEYDVNPVTLPILSHAIMAALATAEAR
jgi:nucleoside-triphosphatase THEP1